MPKQWIICPNCEKKLYCDPFDPDDVDGIHTCFFKKEQKSEKEVAEFFSALFEHGESIEKKKPE